MQSVGFGVSSHPPTFGPGEIKRYRHLLRGYRLAPGRHRVHVSGEAPVRWFQGYGDITRGQPPPKRIPYTPMDPVEGSVVVRDIEINIVGASIEELQRVFAPIAARSEDFYDRDLNREGIYESAQPFDTALIARLAAHPNFKSGAAYEALADINTPESRAHLRRLFDEEVNFDIRIAIVRALSRLLHPDSLDFLASLLPGGRTKYDDSVKSYTLAGLECIGGEKAAAAIVAGTRDWTDRGWRLEILKKYSPREAVDIIIERDAGGDPADLLQWCGELTQLTHYLWCNEELIADVFTWPLDEKLLRPVIAKIQSLWKPWWIKNRNIIRMHGPDDAIADYSSLPKIW